MRPAQSCYDDDSWDCYREQFDKDTGYLLPVVEADDEA
jgi:3-phenylpropionate/cinnamic acid dioxygenase small subunit